MSNIKYCTIEDVIRDYGTRSICIEWDDGSDSDILNNGYTIEDCKRFANEGCRFFYDD